MERTGRRPVGGGSATGPGRMGATGAHRSVGRTPGQTPPTSDTSHIRRAPEGGGGAPARGTAGGATMGGMGLGAKFAIFIALVVAIASSFLVISGYYSVAKEMDLEIDEAGVRLTKALAAPALNEIQKAKAMDDAGLSGIKPIEEILKQLNGMGPLIDPNNKQTFLDKDGRVRKCLEALEKGNKNPFEFIGNDKMGLDAPEIINIVVTDMAGSTGYAYMKKENISLPSAKSRGEKDGVTIEEGIYDAGSPVRARSFKKDVLDENGSPKGRVIVLLRAAKIDSVKSNILTALLIPLVFAIMIGAGIGFYLSTIVTKPLKTLISDIQIVSRGDLEHETKARSTDEVGYLARTFNLMTKSLAQAHEAELETKAMEHELNIAVDIQSNLLPKRIPKIPKFEIGAYYRPSKEVGGDYYDFIQIDQNHLGIIVADVSGKGIPGSMVMTMARSLIRMEAERNLSTADTLIKTNRILARDIRRGMFVTCLYALIDVTNNTMLVSSAGHNPMVVFRRATGKYELINPNGIALGFDKGPIFERTIKEQKIPFAPGDRFVLYTDGVVEAMDGRNVEFGDERFYKMVQSLADKDSNVFINTVVKALDDHKGDAPQHDDITLVTVRVLQP